ncbi:MAG: hypothetical protein UZ16_OP3001003426 [Candidatus Hinthialibacteria bacterium OLB16]|nr:MAG: hypothetical protein UZ16_OP3001003426 [Candidatus Hinthialibacteria bacterium OLB16]
MSIPFIWKGNCPDPIHEGWMARQGFNEKELLLPGYNRSENPGRNEKKKSIQWRFEDAEGQAGSSAGWWVATSRGVSLPSRIR